MTTKLMLGMNMHIEFCITGVKVMIKKLYTVVQTEEASNDLQVFVFPLRLWQVPNCKLNHPSFFPESLS